MLDTLRISEHPFKHKYLPSEFMQIGNGINCIARSTRVVELILGLRVVCAQQVYPALDFLFGLHNDT